MQRGELLDVLDRHFDATEMGDLCFRLGVSFSDDLRGETKRERIADLISYSERHWGVERLVEEVVAIRPNAYWRQKLVDVALDTKRETGEFEPVKWPEKKGQTLYRRASQTGPLRQERNLWMGLVLNQMRERMDRLDSRFTWVIALIIIDFSLFVAFAFAMWNGR